MHIIKFVFRILDILFSLLLLTYGALVAFKGTQTHDEVLFGIGLLEMGLAYNLLPRPRKKR